MRTLSDSTNVIPTTLTACRRLLARKLALSLAGALRSLINVCKTLEGPYMEISMQLQKIIVNENAGKNFWEKKRDAIGEPYDLP